MAEHKEGTIQTPPEWGIEPVPKNHRRLGKLDYFVLWSSLGNGLLVFWAGSLLVPQLDVFTALMIIVAGSLIGSLPLALAGIIGSDNAVPTMVMLRPAFGIRGSFLPSLLNVFQLIGWTTFELVVMSLAADQVSTKILGYSIFYVWVIFFSAILVLTGIGGPLTFVKQWLEKFEIWVLYGSVIWITYVLATSGQIHGVLSAPGKGGLPLLLAMDIVIAMPVSWMPLVSDYSRFAKSSSAGFWGTYIGYVIANVIGYGVGALLVLLTNTADVVAAILLVQFGAVTLLFILTYEADNGFADLYSAAVSIQNLFPKAKQRLLVIGIGILSMVLAMLIPIMQYEWFLLWIGAIFIPIFGVLLIDYFVINRRRYNVQAIYMHGGTYRYWREINLRAIAAWISGAAVYNLIVAYAPDLGASLPTLLVSALIYWLLSKIRPRGNDLIAATQSNPE